MLGRFKDRNDLIPKIGVDVDRNSNFGNPTDGNISTVRGIIMKIIYFLLIILRNTDIFAYNV